MTYDNARLQILFHQRQVMEQPLGSRARNEAVKILREIEVAAKKFFTNEKATVGPVAVSNDFDEIGW